MNISGILVQVLPAKLSKVKEEILALSGVDIPVEHEDGRMVVIIDEQGDNRPGEALMKIQGFDGVLAANLVYQHSEEDSDEDDREITVADKKGKSADPSA